MSFSRKIIRWYEQHKRDLPWRHTSDPFLIWMSEVILQQTRVEQGLPYFIRFSDRFKNIHELATAKESEILKLWQGLGYYSRARNMHLAAKQIVSDYNGKFPASRQALLGISGIGEYTSAAISSFAFGLPEPVVDGNVLRLLSRYYGIHHPINSSAGKNEISDLAKKLIDQKNPSIYNQAIMEFGSLQCRPKNPDCDVCPLSKECVAYKRGIVAKLPIKIKNRTQKKRYFNYVVVQKGKKIALQKRSKKDIWKNLFEFPLIESDRLLMPEQVKKHAFWNKLVRENVLSLQVLKPDYKHLLSHQHIYARFFLLCIRAESVRDGFKMYNMAQIKAMPVSRLMELGMEKVFKKIK